MVVCGVSFDSISHTELLKSVARRVVDRNVLRLIKMWLKASIEERNEDGTRRMSGGKGAKRGRLRAASQALARQHLHEPVPEILASVRLR